MSVRVGEETEPGKDEAELGREAAWPAAGGDEIGLDTCGGRLEDGVGGMAKVTVVVRWVPDAASLQT